jgi:cation transport ATPase
MECKQYPHHQSHSADYSRLPVHCKLQVADTVELGRATLSKIKQNLFWALSYNCVSIPLAAGVLLPAYGALRT